MAKDHGLTPQIVAEFCKAIIDHSGGKWDAAKALVHVLHDEAEKNGAMSDLLGLIGSWGDTLTDEYLLGLLKDYNETGSVPHKEA